LFESVPKNFPDQFWYQSGLLANVNCECESEVEHATRRKMEKDKDIYEAFYRMTNMVDILFADYEDKVEKEE